MRSLCIVHKLDILRNPSNSSPRRPARHSATVLREWYSSTEPQTVVWWLPIGCPNLKVDPPAVAHDSVFPATRRLRKVRLVLNY